MTFDPTQIDELKMVSPDLSIAEEGGHTFFLLKNYKLPNGCVPERMDLLFCPTPINGYESILYFAQQPKGIPTLNWNGRVTLVGKNWFSFSWGIAQGRTDSLLQRFMIHINPLIR